MDVTIKHVSLEDIPLLSHILAASWRVAYRGMIPQDFLDSIEDERWVTPFTYRLTKGGMKADILYVQQAACGCVVYGPSQNKNYSGWGEICCLYLLPEYTRKGYGKQLLLFAMDQMKKENIHDFYLWALDENLSARKFYEKVGYTLTSDIYTVEMGGKLLTDYRYIYKNY